MVIATPFSGQKDKEQFVLLLAPALCKAWDIKHYFVCMEAWFRKCDSEEDIQKVRKTNLEDDPEAQELLMVFGASVDGKKKSSQYIMHRDPDGKLIDLSSMAPDEGNISSSGMFTEVLERAKTMPMILAKKIAESFDKKSESGDVTQKEPTT